MSDEPASPAGQALPAEAPGGGRLFVVATPIGNLSDITLRALEVLAAVPLIAAEDTRHSRRLLDRHRIAARLVSHHARSSPARTEELLAHLRGGADLALITDAGTPAVSDPGEGLVAAWAGEGGTVVPIPGASAVMAAAAASGVAGPRWSFEGFLPRSGRLRRERLARIAADERGSLIFEAPGRVAATLADLAAACGAGRPAAVCRELTKLHESIVRGSLGELAGGAREGRIPARGEFVLVVGYHWPPPPTAAPGADSGAVQDAPAPSAPSGTELRSAALDTALQWVDELVDGGLPRGEAARRVSASTGLPRRRLYRTGPGT